MTLETRRILMKSPMEKAGLESQVEFAANMLLALGLFGSVIPVFTFTWLGLLACAAGCIASFVQLLLLRCVAEVLRLLKHQIGMPYNGTISSHVDTPVYTCENCGMILHSAAYCDGCGARVVGDVEIG